MSYALVAMAGPTSQVRASTPAKHGIVRIDRYKCWTATIWTAGGLSLADGDRVRLEVGDLVLVGTKVAGGPFGVEAPFELVGGNGGWARPIGRTFHRGDGGISVLEVAHTLCVELGEIVVDGELLGPVLEAGAERPLGPAWERPAGVGADALQQLVGDAWWIAPDGSTHLGPRPVRPIAPTTLHVLDFVPALRRATVSLDGDEIAQLLPGAVLTADGLPEPLEVGSTTITFGPEGCTVDLLGERPPSELLSGFVALMTARGRLAAPQLYQVTEAAQGRASARAVGPNAPALPDVSWIDCAFGVPGVSAPLQVGALVGVQLLDGSPGAPRIAVYLPGTLPASVLIDAAGDIALGASSHYLARADRTDAAIVALRAAINIISPGALPSPFPSVATTKARGE